MEVDAAKLRHTARSAVIISHTGIIFPFFLGVTLALATYRELAPAAVGFAAYALFIGIAMSITAFPVLARILQEKNLLHSPLGQSAITCAAVDDVTAWCLLAAVIAVAKSSGLAGALQTLLLALAFIAVMFFLLRPWVERLIERKFDPGGQNRALVAGMLVFAFAAGGFTEVIGIHSLFGAFLAGVMVPAQSRFRLFLRDQIETFGTTLLMPLFFAYTGLRTQIGLLDSAQGVLLCGVIILVAVAGKLGGVMLAARWTGKPWRESFAIGVLMNTRGLMELVVLNIGYDLGILTPRVFTMLVVMALVTTFMTGPLLTLALRRSPEFARALPLRAEE
ncbi:MAG: cation:proton antiporter, partial [Stenotrophobium sp.]